MRESETSDDSYDDDPSGPPGPRHYGEVPLIRRNGFCSGVILAHVLVMFLGLCVPLVSMFGLFTTVGVILVCFIVLTGPVYYDKRNKDGTLKMWGKGNKIAAVILLLLFVGGYAALFYFIVSSGKLGV